MMSSPSFISCMPLCCSILTPVLTPEDHFCCIMVRGGSFSLQGHELLHTGHITDRSPSASLACINSILHSNHWHCSHYHHITDQDSGLQLRRGCCWYGHHHHGDRIHLVILRLNCRCRCQGEPIHNPQFKMFTSQSFNSSLQQNNKISQQMLSLGESLGKCSQGEYSDAI